MNKMQIMFYQVMELVLLWRFLLMMIVTGNLRINLILKLFQCLKVEMLQKKHGHRMEIILILIS